MENSGIVVPKRKLIKVKPLAYADPTSGAWKRLNLRNKAMFAEPTGKGRHLIIDGSFGRIFRSDPECVIDELEQFNRTYQELCSAYDDARNGIGKDDAMPEIMCQNELYLLHGLITCAAGDKYGFSVTEDYRINSIDFRHELVTEGDDVDRFGEPYFYYEYQDYCFPYTYYLEV